MFNLMDVEWSKEQYSLLDLRNTKLEYPLLGKIVQGHYAKTAGSSYHPGEIFILYSWGAQERVMARNKQNICISIPKNHDHKLLLLDRKTQVPLPMCTIVRTHKPPVDVIFDYRATSDFHVNNTLLSSATFGPMRLTASHWLEYLRCYLVREGASNQTEMHALPISLKCVFVVASGDYREIATGVLDQPPSEPQEPEFVNITGYKDLQLDDDNYESVKYHSPLMWGGQPKSVTTDLNRSGGMRSDKQGNGDHDDGNDANPIVNPNMNHFMTSQDHTFQKELRPSFVSELRSRVTTPKTKPTPVPRRIGASIHSSSIPSPKPHMSKALLPPTRTRPIPQPDQKPHQNPATYETPNTMAHGNLKPVQEEAYTELVEGGHLSEGLSRLEDIPADVKGLTVRGVCDCLRLLNLESHVEMFKRQQVDGELLAACTATDFREEFGLSSVSAIKLEMLARKGWRPK